MEIKVFKLSVLFRWSLSGLFSVREDGCIMTHFFKQWICVFVFGLEKGNPCAANDTFFEFEFLIIR